jgi:hypothetical protein
MLNQGGCGLSALAALGIIGMDEYCFAVTNEEYLSSDVGTVGTTLYKLMFSDFLREGGELPELPLCAKRFLVHGIPTTHTVADFEIQINNMRDYFMRTLKENSATLLRFGDQVTPIDPANPLRINETTFGHSIVVFKETGKIYFFDGWMASILTLKSKNMRDFTAKSWNLSVSRRLRQHFFIPLQEFTANNIKAEMILVSHEGETVFEVYEIQSPTPISMNSSFQKRRQEIVVDEFLPRRRPSQVGRRPSQVGRIIAANYRARAPAREAAREAAAEAERQRLAAEAAAEAERQRLAAEAARAPVAPAEAAPSAWASAIGAVPGAIGSFAKHAPGAIFDAIDNTVNRVTANGMNQLRLYTPSGQTVINLGKAAVIGLAYALLNPPPKGGRSRRYKKTIKNRTRIMKY